MKRTLLTTLLFCLAATIGRADVIYYEPFNYPDGCIETNSGGLWVGYSPASPAKDAIVKNHRLENAATGGAIVSRQDDIGRLFATAPGSPYTNQQMMVYASFTVNCTNLPTAGGNYFAHFKDGTTSNFLARVFALTGTPGQGVYPVNFTGLPNTWRLGVAAANNSAPNQVFPVDLALNTDYQVVLGYDPVNFVAATLWVNPLSSSDTSLITGDIVPQYLQSTILTSFAFRQASGAGNSFFTISNLAVATTFDEAATNVWSLTPVMPSIVYQPKAVTNYSGNAATLMAVANGQGLAALSYQWQKDGVNVANPDGNTNVLTIAQLTAGDEGAYTLVVTTPNSLSATSAVAYISVNSTPTPPTFSVQPQDATNNVGTTLTLTASVYGTGPLTYQWFLNGTAVSDGPGILPGDASITSGSQTSTLTIANVSTNQAGSYTLVVSGAVAPSATSSPAIVTIVPPRAVSIAYLRSMEDPTTWQTTNTTTLFNITGTITTLTNLTSGQCSYYIQDGTGGINLYSGGNTNYRPSLGDIVTATGTLLSYYNNLELSVDRNNPYQGASTIGHTTVLPAPVVFSPFSTNNAPYMEALEGSVIMLTNVYFPAVNPLGSANTTITVTNAGTTFWVYFPNAADPDSVGKTLPSFAWTVTGILNQYKSGSTYSKAGYEVNVSRWADVVTAPPSSVTASAACSGGQVVLNWTAVPYTAVSGGAYSYSVYAATNIAGPYLPLATGLAFNTTAGTYTDTAAIGSAKFYKISSP